MLQPSSRSQRESANLEAVHGLVEQHMARNELVIPSLPIIAVRVVRSVGKNSGNAHLLAEIIQSDPTLARYVLSIASSAAKRPCMPITSLQHAIAWLGLDDVANIAFTLALQGKMLRVEGQQRRARRLWRHSLASALWARQLSSMLRRETGLPYLCGLLHGIGKAVALGAIHAVAERAALQLAGAEYDCLIEVFQREAGARVVASWALPAPVPAVIAHWDSYAAAGALHADSNLINVAHKLADFTLREPCMLSRELLLQDPAYRDLGLGPQHADPLFDSTAPINAELDRYLSP